jgi:hypothetical protein
MEYWITIRTERCSEIVRNLLLCKINFWHWNLTINSVAWVRKRTVPTERQPLVGEVSSNFFADRGCHVVSVTNPYGRIFGFLHRSRYHFFQVASQLYSRGWVDSIPDQLLRNSGRAGNWTRDLWICSQEDWLLDHRAGLWHWNTNNILLDSAVKDTASGFISLAQRKTK